MNHESFVEDRYRKIAEIPVFFPFPILEQKVHNRRARAMASSYKTGLSYRKGTRELELCILRGGKKIKPVLRHLSNYQQKYLWIAHKTVKLRLDEAEKAIKGLPAANLNTIPTEFTEEWLRQVIARIKSESEQVSDSSPHWNWVIQPDHQIEKEIRQSMERIDDAKMDHHENDKREILLQLKTSRNHWTNFTPREQKFIYHALAMYEDAEEDIETGLLEIGFRKANRGGSGIRTRMFPELVRYIDTQAQRTTNTRSEHDHWRMIRHSDPYTVSDVHKFIGRYHRRAVPPQQTQYGGNIASHNPPGHLTGALTSNVCAPNPPNPPQGAAGFQPGAPVGPYNQVPMPPPGLVYGAGSPGNLYPEGSLLSESGQRPAPGVPTNYQGALSYQTAGKPVRHSRASGVPPTPGYTRYYPNTSNAPDGVAIKARVPDIVDRALNSDSARTRPSLQAQSSRRTSSNQSGLTGRNIETEREREARVRAGEHQRQQLAEAQRLHDEQQSQQAMMRQEAGQQRQFQGSGGYTQWNPAPQYVSEYQPQSGSGMSSQFQGSGGYTDNTRSSRASDFLSPYESQPGSEMRNQGYYYSKRLQTPTEEQQSHSSQGSSSPAPRHRGPNTPLPESRSELYKQATAGQTKKRPKRDQPRQQ